MDFPLNKIFVSGCDHMQTDWKCFDFPLGKLKKSIILEKEFTYFLYFAQALRWLCNALVAKTFPEIPEGCV